MKLRKKIEINNKEKIFFVFVIILSLTYFILKSFGNNSLPYLFQFAESQSINVANSLINKAIYQETFFDYDKDIVVIEKNTNDEIINVNYNTQKLNIILISASENILKNISLLEKGKINDINFTNYNKDDLIYYVPFGIMHNVPILTDLGPRIPYKISFLGSIDSRIDTNIKEYGINNCLVEVFLNVSLNVQIIFPFISKTTQIEKNIPLSSNLIQGKIPSYYGGIITNSSPIKSN